MRRLVLASLLVILAAAPARAAASPTPAPSVVPSALPSASPVPSVSPKPTAKATTAAKPSPAPSASPAVRTFLGLPTGNRAVAAGLSLAVNGLGQFYNGDGDKGKLMMAPLLVFPVAYGFDYLTGSAYMRIFAFAINLSIKPWSVYDAWQNAVPPPSPSPVPSPAPSASPSH